MSDGLLYVGDLMGFRCYLDMHHPPDTITLSYDKSIMRNNKIDSILNDEMLKQGYVAPDDDEVRNYNATVEGAKFRPTTPAGEPADEDLIARIMAADPSADEHDAATQGHRDAGAN